MSKRKNVHDTESFIKKARTKHGDKYDYSQVEYTKNQAKVKIGCPVHGTFEQSAKEHLKGFGCNRCGWDVTKQKLLKSTDDFISDAIKIHGDKYNYSKVEYKGAFCRITIKCPSHGEFLQTPTDHLSGKGCNKCAGEYRGKKRRMSSEDFFSRVKQKHGEKYDYSETIFTKTSDKVKIICPKHGPFEQAAHKHLAGQGCRVCGKEKLGRNPNSAYGLIGYYGSKSIAYLYLFQIGDKCLKLGVAKDFELRKRQLEKCTGELVTVIRTVKGKAVEVFKKEQQLLSKYREYNFDMGIEFHGRTECLDLSLQDKLESEMEKIDER